MKFTLFSVWHRQGHSDIKWIKNDTSKKQITKQNEKICVERSKLVKSFIRFTHVPPRMEIRKIQKMTIANTIRIQPSVRLSSKSSNNGLTIACFVVSSSKLDSIFGSRVVMKVVTNTTKSTACHGGGADLRTFSDETWTMTLPIL